MNTIELRATEALDSAGIETYGPGLVDLSASVLEAVDAAGEDAPEEHLEAIVDAHFGPGRESAEQLFALVNESVELLTHESDAVLEATTILDALGDLIWRTAYDIALAEWQRLQRIKSIREELPVRRALRRRGQLEALDLYDRASKP